MLQFMQVNKGHGEQDDTNLLQSTLMIENLHFIFPICIDCFILPAVYAIALNFSPHRVKTETAYWIFSIDNNM